MDDFLKSYLASDRSQSTKDFRKTYEEEQKNKALYEQGQATRVISGYSTTPVGPDGSTKVPTYAYIPKQAAPAPPPAPAPPAPAAPVRPPTPTTPTNNYQSQIAALTARIADQQAKYELQIKDYTNKQAAAAEARKTTEAGYLNKLSSMESSYLENLKNTKAQYATQAANTKTQYATQAENRQAEYERMMLAAQSQYDQRTKDALAGYNTQLQTTKTDLENSYLNNLQIQQDKYTEQAKNTRTLLESSFAKTLQDERSQYETQSAATKAAYDKQIQGFSDRDAERAATQKSYLENLRIQQDSRLSQMALDAKTRADDLALGQRTYQQNQSRSNQLGDLQIGNAGGAPRIGGTQNFKRRKLQVNPATANALSGILGGTAATSSTNILNV